MAPKIRIDYVPDKTAMQEDYERRTAPFHRYETQFVKVAHTAAEDAELAELAAYAGHLKCPPGADPERTVV